MNYTKIINGVVDKYPLTEKDIIIENPNVSFPSIIGKDTFADLDYYPVVESIKPLYIADTQRIDEVMPICINNVWVQQWLITDLSEEEVTANQDIKIQRLKSDVILETQKHLDSFANTRNYDSILSACTYATSSMPKFAAEGQYAVSARNNTWIAIYNLMAEVQAGTKPMPTGFVDVEPLLPELVWPN